MALGRCGLRNALSGRWSYRTGLRHPQAGSCPPVGLEFLPYASAGPEDRRVGTGPQELADHDENLAELAVAHRALGYSLLIAGELREADEMSLGEWRSLTPSRIVNSSSTASIRAWFVGFMAGRRSSWRLSDIWRAAREEAVAFARREENAHSLAWALAAAARIYQIPMTPRQLPALPPRPCHGAGDHLPQWLATG